MQQPLYLLFVDLTAAFDHIPRQWLFKSIRLRFSTNQSIRMIDILERLYENTTLTYDEADTTFKTTSGVRQGGPESPFLFTLYIDYVMRVFIDKCSSDDVINFFEYKYRLHCRTFTREDRVNMRNENTQTWGSSTLPWSGYADDLVLFLTEQLGLSNATLLLNEIFNKFGLTVNKLKTETMILNSPDISEQSIVTLQNVKLNNIAVFKYLGSYVDSAQPNTGDSEINHRIQAAVCKFAELSYLLQNFHIHLRTRVKFLDSFVRSRLTYGCQNWNLTTNQYDRLDVTYRRFLRRMIRGGFRYVDENANDFRLVITNDRLHNVCGTTDVSEFIKHQQNSYASHIIRMSIDRGVKKLMFNDDTYVKKGRSQKTLLEQVIGNNNVTLDVYCNNAMKKKLGN